MVKEISNILIVEDELLIAQDLKDIIEETGRKSAILTSNYQQAIDILSTQQIHLCLVDIKLKGGKSGVDIANYINENNKIPFIFITSYSDSTTLESVMNTHPSAFLLKPVSKEQLLAKIKIVLFSFRHNSLKVKGMNPKIENITEIITDNHFLIKVKTVFIKVYFDEIIFIESNKNYIVIKTVDKKYSIRMPLRDAYKKLPKEYFVKCNKQCIVNLKHVDSFTIYELKIQTHIIPISRTEQKEVHSKLKNRVL